MRLSNTHKRCFGTASPTGHTRELLPQNERLQFGRMPMEPDGKPALTKIQARTYPLIRQGTLSSLLMSLCRMRDHYVHPLPIVRQQNADRMGDGLKRSG